MASIPNVAARWIVSQLPGRATTSDSIADHIERYGLDILSVKELIVVEALIYAKEAVRSEPSIMRYSLPRSARKQMRVEFVRRAFFRDSSCKNVNLHLLGELETENRNLQGVKQNLSAGVTAAAPHTLNASSPAAASSSMYATSASSRAELLSLAPRTVDSSSGPGALSAYIMAHYHPEIQQGYGTRIPQMSMPQHMGVSATDFESMMHGLVGTSLPSPDEPLSPHLHQYPINSLGEPSPSLNGMDLQRNNPSNGGPSTEAALCFANGDPNGPQNEKEYCLLEELKQMGFTNSQEVLNGIRQCGEDEAEKVMVFLISQREEADEARKEDEVRLRSEEQKEEESIRKERNMQERLQAATVEDLCKIFPESWILEGLEGCYLRSTEKEYRSALHQFLQLELKSRLWYNHLPSFYFNKICARLNSGEKPDWLERECESLQSGLFKLEEQKGGTPKLFLNERPDDNLSVEEVIEIE